MQYDVVKELNLYQGTQDGEKRNPWIQNNNYIKHVVKELHDTYKPEAIFLTMTSATLFGFAIKEMWKTIWPEEKQPVFLTVDKWSEAYIHRNKKLNRLHHKHKKMRIEEMPNGKHLILEDITDKETYNREIKATQENWLAQENLKTTTIAKKLTQYNIKGNIAIVDEYMGFGLKNNKPILLEEHQKILCNPSTLEATRELVQAAMEKTSNPHKLITTGLFYERAEDGPWRRPHIAKGNKEIQRVHNTGEEGQRAEKRIKLFKSWGHTLGLEMRNEELAHMKRKKKLERIIGAVMGVLAIGFLFVGGTYDSITGATIGASGTHGTLLSIALTFTFATAIGLLLHAEHGQSNK